MMEGSCHCGAVTWRLAGVPESATACNCTVCRRYGVLWAYHYEGEAITVAGPSKAYIRGRGVEFHFCPTCGCVAFWRAQQAGDDGRRRIAVNLRMTEPGPIAPVLDVAQALDSPFVHERQGVVDFDYTDGRHARMVASPIRIRGVDLPTHAAPRMGEHTDALLRGAGFDDEAIGRLRALGVIAG